MNNLKQKNTTIAASVLLVVILIVSGCSSAGAGDGSGGGVGSGGSGGGSGDTLGSLSLSALLFEYETGQVSQPYVTEVYIFSSESAMNGFRLGQPGTSASVVAFGFYDATDAATVEPGTYNLAGSGASGTFDVAVLIADGDFDGDFEFSRIAEGASNLGSSLFQSLFGVPSTYRKITGGTVVVSQSGGTYTFTWTLVTGAGNISGSYTGVVDETDPYS